VMDVFSLIRGEDTFWILYFVFAVFVLVPARRLEWFVIFANSVILSWLQCADCDIISVFISNRQFNNTFWAMC